MRIRPASRLIRSSTAQESGSSTSRSSVRSRSSCSACSCSPTSSRAAVHQNQLSPRLNSMTGCNSWRSQSGSSSSARSCISSPSSHRLRLVIRVGGADQAAAPGQRIALVFQDDDGPAGIRKVPDDVAVAQGESSTEGQARGEHARLAQRLGPVDHDGRSPLQRRRGGCRRRRRPARTAGLRWSRASRTAPPRPVGPRSRLAPRRRPEAGRLRRGGRQRAARRAGPDPASGWPSALRTPT